MNLFLGHVGIARRLFFLSNRSSSNQIRRSSLIIIATDPSILIETTKADIDELLNQYCES